MQLLVLKKHMIHLVIIVFHNHVTYESCTRSPFSSSIKTPSLSEVMLVFFTS